MMILAIFLHQLCCYFNNITYISYLTVEPNKEEINPYIEALNKEVLNDKDTELWLIGRMVNFIDEKHITPKTKVFKSISELIINL